MPATSPRAYVSKFEINNSKLSLFSSACPDRYAIAYDAVMNKIMVILERGKK